MIYSNQLWWIRFKWKKKTIASRANLPSLASSKFLGWPHRSSMMRRLSAALRSCSFFNSSAAFLRSSNYKVEKKKKIYCELTKIVYNKFTYSKLLLSLRCHETLLCLLCCSSLFETLAHFSFFAICVLLLLFSRLRI